MEENKHCCPPERGEGDARPARVCLLSETPSGAERFAAAAEMREEAGVPVYSFLHGGARYRVAAGERLRIGREGELAYELVLDPRSETEVSIRTPYGEIGALARVLSLQCGREGGRLSLDCTYILDFSGGEQRHRLRFSARPCPSGEGGRL